MMKPKPKQKPKAKVRARSAITGRFITMAEAIRDKFRAVIEKIRVMRLKGPR